MSNFRSTLYFIRVFLDILIIIISFVVAHSFAVGKVYFDFSNADFLLLFVIILAWYFTASKINLYDEFRSRNFSYEFVCILKSIFYHALTVVTAIFLISNDLPKIFALYYITYTLLLLVLEKYVVRQLLKYYRKKGRNLRTMLIIGAGPVGISFYKTINSNPQFGYQVLGFLDDKVPSSLNGEYIGSISALNNVLEDFHVDNVIVALPNYATHKLSEIIRICENHTTRIRIIPDYFRFVSSKYKVGMFGNFPIISVREDKINDIHNRFIKRVFDIIFSLMVIIFILSWLLPIISLLVKISSPGPIFFAQERWGRDNKKFKVLKFRTMVCESSDVDESGKYIQAKKNDPRITKIGKFLRKTNLDELPQFFNVLLGDMSVVGPRPHPIPLNIESKDCVERYMLRHLVKPGITGWAQVNGYRGETREIRLMQKRVDHDLWYIENWSFWLDIQIILLTIWKMIKGDPQAY